MSLPPEHVDAPYDIIYLAKNPLYEFMLKRSTPVSPEPRSQPSLVQLQFMGQVQQQGIVLSLAALEQFHDALSRLLDYIKQECARGSAIASSGSSMEGSTTSSSGPLDRDSTADHVEASHRRRAQTAPYP
jgi:hypothetical protein